MQGGQGAVGGHLKDFRKSRSVEVPVNSLRESDVNWESHRRLRRCPRLSESRQGLTEKECPTGSCVSFHKSSRLFPVSVVQNQSRRTYTGPKTGRRRNLERLPHFVPNPWTPTRGVCRTGFRQSLGSTSWGPSLSISAPIDRMQNVTVPVMVILKTVPQPDEKHTGLKMPPLKVVPYKFPSLPWMRDEGPVPSDPSPANACRTVIIPLRVILKTVPAARGTVIKTGNSAGAGCAVEVPVRRLDQRGRIGSV